MPQLGRCRAFRISRQQTLAKTKSNGHGGFEQKPQGGTPGFSRPRSLPFHRRPFLVGRLLGLGVGALVVAAAAHAEKPSYRLEALATFSAEVPSGWAYTLKTERNEHQLVERFDPAKPLTEQWTLLLTDGRSPTPKDLTQYAKFKAVQPTGAAQATFQKGDLEPGSMALLSEDARRAEYRCSFREQSANADKMLGHVTLRLQISKQPAYVEKYTLELPQPYSPVLGVKMNELVVEVSFSPPADDRPSLPLRSISHFRGRMLLFPVEENLRLTYSEYVPRP